MRMENKCSYILVVEGEDSDLMLKAFSKANELFGCDSPSIKNDRFKDGRFFVLAPSLLDSFPEKVLLDAVAQQDFMDWVDRSNARTGANSIRIHKVNFDS